MSQLGAPDGKQRRVGEAIFEGGACPRSSGQSRAARQGVAKFASATWPLPGMLPEQPKAGRGGEG